MVTLLFVNVTALYKQNKTLQNLLIFTLYFLLFTGYWKAKPVGTLKMCDECDNVS